MQQFIPISDVNNDQESSVTSSHLKVLNVSTIMAKVTDEGHKLMPGEQAYVLAGSKNLEEALARRSVILLGGDGTPTEDDKQPRKKPVPKAQASAEATAVPVASDGGPGAPAAKKSETGSAEASKPSAGGDVAKNDPGDREQNG